MSTMDKIDKVDNPHLCGRQAPFREVAGQLRWRQASGEAAQAVEGGNGS